jgi:hypothetical protein
VHTRDRLMRLPMRRAVVAAVLVAAMAAPGAAQASRRDGFVPAPGQESQSGRARVEVSLPSSTTLSTEGPLVRAAQVLADGELHDLIRNGFPAQLHYRVELWSNGRWLDDYEGKAEWDVIVRYDPLGKSFRVVRIIGENVEPVGEFVQYADAVAAVERPYRAPIAPPPSRRAHYYNVVLDVVVLSLGDLDELDRWLRGELRPAVRGRRNPATAVTRGVGTLMVRLLGGEKRRYVKRSENFRVERNPER